jgi:hypothetical protein
MSLPARQRRALDRIEKTLDRDHPALGSLFATFTRLTGHEAMPVTEQVTGRRWRIRPGITTLIGLAMATGALLALSLTLQSQRLCAPGTITAVAAHVRSLQPAACAVQQNNPSTTSQTGPPHAR